VKGQCLVFLLAQTSDSLRIELAIFDFEGSQVRYGPLLGGLSPDAKQFRLDVTAHPPGNGVEHIVLLVQETTLARRRRKQCLDCRQQSIMAIGHNEIDLRRSARSDVLQDTHPAVFTFLSTYTQRQYVFVAGHVHTQHRQDHRRIGLVPMTYLEMDAIEIED